MVVQPRLASTVMLVRDAASEQNGYNGIEVFMVRRVVQSEFMPDVYVFPGGSVSSDDQIAERTEGLCAPTITPPTDPEGRTALGNGVRAAAIRELFEEANVLLAYRDQQMLSVTEKDVAHFAGYRQAFNERRGSLVAMARDEKLLLATDCLVYGAHWITPVGSPKRYDTHFFLATAPTAQEALYDALETSEGIWVAPSIALERFQQGAFPVAFPTYRQLHDLSTFASVQEALQIAGTRPVPTHMPVMTQVDGKAHVYLPADPERTWQI